MRLRSLFFEAAVLLLASCSNELELSSVQGSAKVETVPLTISVQQQATSKSFVDSSYLPDGASLGVFLCAKDGTLYDGLRHENVKFTASGEEAAQVWSGDASHPINLSATEGKAFAYYPWQAASVTDLKVPITNDGTDWMYAAAPTNTLSSSNATAQFTMNHATALVRCRLVKGSYYDPGVVSAVAVSGVGLGNRGIMDLEASKVTGVEGGGTELISNAVGNLSAEAMAFDIWTIPTGEKGEVRFRVVADGNEYVALAPEVLVESGRIYAFTLTLNSKTLDVSEVSIAEWTNEVSVDESPGITDTWDVARQSDGVYAIDEFGDPVPYAEAKADAYKGVAFVLKGVAYQVAKVNATDPEGNEAVYFWKEGYRDIDTVRIYLSSDGDQGGAYLTNKEPSLSTDPSDWVFGAISDDRGFENTEAFIAAQLTDGVPQAETIAPVVLNFRQDAACNEGYDNWFVPSAQQLAYMYLKRNEIEELLTRSGGTSFTQNYYLSSSRGRSYHFWSINFVNGYLNISYTYNLAYCRLIRYVTEKG